MHRRQMLLAAAALALPRPALAQPANARTLRFVPQANLTSLDPVWTTAAVSRDFGLLVYDTLYGIDSTLTPRPQMAEGHSVDDDGKRWTIKLREGLLFHDGSRVLARDCAASVARWMRRDPLGQAMQPRLDAIEAPDDRTLVFRLNKPFPRLLTMIGKLTAAGIMPERLAKTDAYTAVTEIVGSGPFRFVPGEYVSGSRAVFARAETYLPRQEAPDFCAGAKRALVDRVEWHIIPDAATAVGALDRRGDRLDRHAPARLAAAASPQQGHRGWAAGPDRAVPAMPPEHAAGADRQCRGAPGDPGRDRPARGDAGGDGG